MGTIVKPVETENNWNNVRGRMFHVGRYCQYGLLCSFVDVINLVLK